VYRLYIRCLCWPEKGRREKEKRGDGGKTRGKKGGFSLILKSLQLEREREEKIAGKGESRKTKKGEKEERRKRRNVWSAPQAQLLNIDRNFHLLKPVRPAETGRSATYREEVWLLNIERNIHLRFCISSSATKTSETCKYKSPLSPPLPHINLLLFWCFKKYLFCILALHFRFLFSFCHTMNACLLFLSVALSLDGYLC